MKFLYSFIIISLISSAVFAQKINYQKTFQETLSKAAESNKPIFLAINQPTSIKMQASGLDAPEVAELYNKTFIAYAVSISDTSSASFIKKYEVAPTYPSYLMLDSKGNLLYRASGNFVKSDRYINLANKAIEKLNSGRTVSYYEEKYKAGPVTAQLLKDYITERENVGLFNNAKLADEYVDYLTIKSFQNYQEVLFVLKAGPYVYGKAYTLCYTNRKITDSLYKTEPVGLRQAINNRMINNSTLEAISIKSPAMAQQVSNFIRAISGNDYQNSNLRTQYNMLSYYQAVRDTAHYYQTAQYYYDGFMRVSPDSTQKLKKKQSENASRTAIARFAADSTLTKMVKDTAHIKTFRAVTTPQPIPDTYNPTALTLNNGAWNFYLLGSRNPTYLTKALLWSKRSIVLEPNNSSYYDTLAHLLYRLDFYSEAEADQSKAISLATDAKIPQQQIDKFKAELKLMKERKL